MNLKVIIATRIRRTNKHMYIYIYTHIYIYV